MTIRTGQTDSIEIEFTRELVAKFSELSGDKNPLHLEDVFAQSSGFHKSLAHGALQIAVLSNIIGMRLPGKGALWRSLNISWLKPIYVGDRARVSATVKSTNEASGVIELDISIDSPNGALLASGQAVVKLLKQEEAAMNDGTRRRTALVTGSNGAVGSAVCRALAESGFDIAFAYGRKDDVLSPIADTLAERGLKFVRLSGDLSKPDAARDVARKAIEALSHIDTFVHAASAPIVLGNCEEPDFDEVERHLSVTFRSSLEFVSELAPNFSQRKNGRFIFLGTAAMHGAPPRGWAPYLAAKHALWGYIRSCASELGKSGITTNMVSPTMIVSELTAGIPLSVKEIEAARNPMRRMAVADDVAAMVAYLASDKARFINGQNILVSGGSV